VGYYKPYRIEAPSRGVRIATGMLVVVIVVGVLLWSFSLG
jgi:hypothetical protein